MPKFFQILQIPSGIPIAQIFLRAVVIKSAMLHPGHSVCPVDDASFQCTEFSSGRGKIADVTLTADFGRCKIIDACLHPEYACPYHSTDRPAGNQQASAYLNLTVDGWEITIALQDSVSYAPL